MPELQRLLIGDDPQAWEAAGFTVTGGETLIGGIAVRFVDLDRPHGENRRAVGWELSGLDDAAAGSIDGIETLAVDTSEPAMPGQHPAHRNRVSRMDHVVIMTPDLDRTVSSLAASGFSPRRTRDIPGAEPPRSQVFLWAGETILEVVGPVAATGSGPATIWGLALTTDDIDAATAELGTAVSKPKEAVQPGRRIATIKTKDLGVSIALALMTPHVPTEQPDQAHTPGSQHA